MYFYSGAPMHVLSGVDIAQLVVADRGRQLVQRNRKVGELHLTGQHLMQRPAAAFRAIDRYGVLFDKGRAEERKALDVVPVRVADENVRLDGLLALPHQLQGKPVRAGAAVKDQEIAITSGQLNTGGVAAKVVGGRPGRCNRTPRSPKTYPHACAFIPSRHAEDT